MIKNVKQTLNIFTLRLSVLSSASCKIAPGAAHALSTACVCAIMSVCRSHEKMSSLTIPINFSPCVARPSVGLGLAFREKLTAIDRV